MIFMKIEDIFKKLNGKGALIAYVAAGDPTPKSTKKIVNALVEGGADIIELGLPFSDPIADGPTIQAATERALESGMNPDLYFEMVSSLEVEVPLVCMTYYNLIFKRGLEKFVIDCINSGITGIIVPDLPIEESMELEKYCRKHGVDLIYLVAPTTPDKRIKKIASRSSGFLYLVARLGVTGARKDIASSTMELLNRVQVNIPKAVGFGISNGEQAREIIRGGADGVIVGSAFVDIIASGYDVTNRVRELAKELKKGIISATLYNK